MKKAKILLKPVIILALSNSLAYLLYLLLLVLGVLHYYELESAGTAANTGVFCFYFLSTAVLTLALTSTLRLEAVERKALLVLLVLTDVISMNFSGSQEICTLLLPDTASGVVVKVTAFVLSSGVLMLSAIAGELISKKHYN